MCLEKSIFLFFLAFFALLIKKQKKVFKIKHNIYGTINKHKTRLVVKGYAQVFGVNIFDTFSPIVRLDTIRMLVITVQERWKIH